MNHLINGVVNATWGRLSATVKAIILIIAALVVILLFWLYGARAINGIQSWWFQRGVNQSQKEIQDLKNVASEALKELQLEKQRTAEERARREIAERILADKTLDANEKIEAYEKAMQKPVNASPVGSTADLCARAAELGISCD